MTEAKLVELLATSKKALQVGESMASQASAFIERSQHDMDAVERTWPRLRFLDDEIEAQLKTFSIIKTFLDAEKLEIHEYIQSKQAEIQQVKAEMAKIFEILNDTVVEAGIHQLGLQSDVTGDGSIPQRTLFDYVDDQGVLEMQGRMHDELSAVEDLGARFASHIETLRTELSDVTQSRSSLLSLDLGPAFDFVAEKRAGQQAEMGNMADMLVDLARHYDQIDVALSHAKNDPDLDISVLERDTNDLNLILTALQDSLETIELTCNDLNVRAQQVTSTYTDLARLYNALADLASTPLDDLLSSTRSIIAEFQTGSQFETYLEESWNLLAWYGEFRYAYDQLVLEIDRRKSVADRVKRVAEEYKRALEGLYNDEVDRRAAWFDDSGRYIPQDLCPGILDPPIQFEIMVSEDTNNYIRHTVSEAAVQQAHKNTQARQRELGGAPGV